MNNEKLKKLYELKPFEEMGIDKCTIQRVPGGWIFTTIPTLETDSPSTAFVPYNEEFKPVEKQPKYVIELTNVADTVCYYAGYAIDTGEVFVNTDIAWAERFPTPASAWQFTLLIKKRCGGFYKECNVTEVIE